MSRWVSAAVVAVVVTGSVVALSTAASAGGVEPVTGAVMSFGMALIGMAMLRRSA